METIPGVLTFDLVILLLCYSVIELLRCSPLAFRLASTTLSNHAQGDSPVIRVSSVTLKSKELKT